MTKIGKLFRKIWAKIEWLFDQMDEFTKTSVDASVKMCEKLKLAVDNGDFDMFCNVVELVIPGDQSAISASIKKGLIKNLPIWISDLQLISIIDHSANLDWSEQMRAVFEALKSGSETALTPIWQGIPDKFMDYMSDGVFSRAERREFIDWYYHTKVKAQKS